MADADQRFGGILGQKISIWDIDAGQNIFQFDTLYISLYLGISGSYVIGAIYTLCNTMDIYIDSPNQSCVMAHSSHQIGFSRHATKKQAWLSADDSQVKLEPMS
jgi:hypothetical protein